MNALLSYLFHIYLFCFVVLFPFKSHQNLWTDLSVLTTLQYGLKMLLHMSQI